jgi:CDP-diglyceride synthetase
MRDSYDMEIPDTAPYKEWLGVVGSIVVAALVGVILFSGGILS